jgi:hypothetical protein
VSAKTKVDGKEKRGERAKVKRTFVTTPYSLSNINTSTSFLNPFASSLNS